MALVHRLVSPDLKVGFYQSILGFLGIPLIGIQGIIKGMNKDAWAPSLAERIISILSLSPGLHFRELQRRLGAANGTLRHRLRKMERSGEVFVERTNGRVCYFSGPPTQLEILEGVEVIDNARASSLLPVGLSKLQRKIVCELVDGQIHSTQADLARSLGRSRSAVNSAVMVLRERGILQIDELKLESHLSCLSNTMPTYDWVEYRSNVSV